MDIQSRWKARGLVRVEAMNVVGEQIGKYLRTNVAARYNAKVGIR